MNVERLRRIIYYSRSNRENIETALKKYYSFIRMDQDQDVLNLMQIVRPSFRKKGFLVLELPFEDKEIGALSYKGDGLGYIVLNTSLPKVNVNFALCHEVYHVFYQKSEFRSELEFANDHYYEHEEEFSANLFAGMLLMPETGFRQMYHIFKEESNGSEIDTLVRLMNYYQVPYMAALIRCFELELPEPDAISDALLNMDSQAIRERFSELWLDTEILNASQKDDYPLLEDLVNRFGQEYIQDEYINERTLEKALQNMRRFYSEIKGE